MVAAEAPGELGNARPPGPTGLQPEHGTLSTRNHAGPAVLGVLEGSPASSGGSGRSTGVNRSCVPALLSLLLGTQASVVCVRGVPNSFSRRRRAGPPRGGGRAQPSEQEARGAGADGPAPLFRSPGSLGWEAANPRLSRGTWSRHCVLFIVTLYVEAERSLWRLRTSSGARGQTRQMSWGGPTLSHSHLALGAGPFPQSN